jgi:hypothetical protein
MAKKKPANCSLRAKSNPWKGVGGDNSTIVKIIVHRNMVKLRYSVVAKMQRISVLTIMLTTSANWTSRADPAGKAS